jgi:hypothetical protein
MLFSALAGAAFFASASGFEIALDEGPPSPLSVALPEGVPQPREGMAPVLFEVAGERRAEIPCQIEERPGGTFLWFFAPAAASARTARFTLEWKKHDGKPPAEICAATEVKPGTFLFKAGPEPLFCYNYGFVKQEGFTPAYDRGDYVHPAFGPAGEVLTDDFPKDHPHHRGLFWSWPRVVVGAETYDPWALVDSRQWPCSLKLGATGTISASLEAEFVWRTEKGMDFVKELFTLRTYRPIGTTRLIDCEIRLWAASDAETKFGGRLDGKKGYGGLNFRFPPRSEAGLVMDGEKITAESVDQKPARWSDLSAIFPGAKKRSGVTVCGHPRNPAWPERWCNRYYGILGTASPGLDLLTLTRDNPIVFRYRIVVHEGTSEEAHSEGHSRRFASPPTVTWR